MEAADKIFLNVGNDFSKTPGPREIWEGDFSGELFRTACLEPAVRDAIEKNGILFIDLDGTAGYGTSFLEESFGGLIRKCNYQYDQLIDHLEFKSDEEPYLIEDIMEYLRDAAEYED